MRNRVVKLVWNRVVMSMWKRVVIRVWNKVVTNVWNRATIYSPCLGGSQLDPGTNLSGHDLVTANTGTPCIDSDNTLTQELGHHRPSRDWDTTGHLETGTPQAI